jgi:hypothetical protein
MGRTSPYLLTIAPPFFAADIAGEIPATGRSVRVRAPGHGILKSDCCPTRDASVFADPFLTRTFLKNVHPSGKPIRPHPLRCGPFAVP